ncbi:aminoglycoside adenylyltransferase family protein [Streptomyces lonarensis]|uniref:aminoglycoside adenylyltransferase family protein n=1 Tax=Streptomyces lonarensis TaxID=700599 RepID=UPI0030C67A0E
MAGVDDQISRVRRLVESVLGPALRALYLHGSAVAGGLRPASDLDLLAVTDRSLDGEQRERLVTGLLELSGPGGGPRPVELLVVVRGDVVPWRYPPRADLLFGEWLRPALLRDPRPRPADMPDLAVLLTGARSAGRVLAGPPPDRELPAVPAGDVARATVAAVPELLAEVADDTRNAVLTLARVWTTLATGEIRSKDAAARWALPRLPAARRPVLAHALRLYRESDYAAEWWPAGLRQQAPEYAAHLAARIAAAAGRDAAGEAAELPRPPR